MRRMPGAPVVLDGAGPWAVWRHLLPSSVLNPQKAPVWAFWAVRLEISLVRILLAPPASPHERLPVPSTYNSSIFECVSRGEGSLRRLFPAKGRR